MKVVDGHMIALGYGKYFRSDSIVGLEPIEEGRGPGKRTMVFIQNVRRPFVASRSETSILRDLIDRPKEITKSQQLHSLLADILDTIQGIDPMLRSIVRDQGRWDLDRLEERIKDVLSEDDPTQQADMLPF